MTDDERRERAKRRLRVFGFHLMGYMVVMTVLIPVNLLTMPESLVCFSIGCLGCTARHTCCLGDGIVRRLVWRPLNDVKEAVL